MNPARRKLETHGCRAYFGFLYLSTAQGASCASRPPQESQFSQIRIIQETGDIENRQTSQPLEVLVLEIRALKVGMVETGVFL